MKFRTLTKGPISLILLWCFAQGSALAQTPAAEPLGPNTSAATPAELPAEPASAPAVVAPDAEPAEPAGSAPPATVGAAPATAPVVAAEAVEAPEPVPAPPARLDYSDGSFLFRSIDDNIVVVPGGRMHVDTYTFAGQGVANYHKDNGTGLKTNLFFRRLVLEVYGMIRKDWFFGIGANFAPTTIDAAQASISTANVYDGFVGYMPNEHLRLYVGQYNAPYTMENVTSSRWLDLMERPLVVRTVATPYNKADGIMAWGETASKSFEYQVGVFGGDGMNRPNIDNFFDVMGRVLVRPLIGPDGHGNRFHIGGGARFGSRDEKFVRYDAPGLSTPGGYTFWSPKYGSGPEETHIMPDAQQFSAAVETYIPVEQFDVKGELVYVNEGRREALASDRATSLRDGALTGLGGYLQLSYWALGSARINGNPAGYYGVTKLPKDLGKQDPYALQLVARAELMRLKYDGDSRWGQPSTGGYAATQNIKVDAYQFGINYWATKHVRLTGQYSAYVVPASANQAVAPGRKMDPTSDASVLHELSFRLGLAL